MTAGEGVVFRLRRRWERLYAMQLTVGAEQLPSTCQNLMAISLMTYIPYDAVLWGVIDIMQRHGQFQGTKARSEVSGIDSKFVDDVLTQFIAELWQLFYLQSSKIRRIIYFF